MARAYDTEELGADDIDEEDPFGRAAEADEERQSSHDDPDAGLAPATARERKKQALYPPIANICSAMGGFEEYRNEEGEIETAYSLGDQVIGCLKDLKRFWRMDEKDDDRTVARIFAEIGVLKNDLIPILLTTLGTGAKGDRIALACVEMIGAMTWPINVIEELRDAQALDELRAGMDYTGLIAAQLFYKSAILRTGSLRAMFQLMTPSLTKNRRERTNKDESIITLVLHTFRNLAALKDPISASESADAIELRNLQSDYIQQLADENIFDLLIAIAHNAESPEYAPWNLITLDIFHLVFRSVKPAELMIPASKIDETRLKYLLDVESLRKKAAARAGNSRHSRFGTTLALKSNGKSYIVHKQSSLAKGAEKTMDSLKKNKAKKHRKDDDLQPPSSLRPAAIRCLQSVAVSFIDSAFNPFFASVLKDIRMERLKVKEADTVRFLFLSRFFLEFFLLLHHDEQAKGIDPQSDEGHDFDLIAEMTETHAIGFVTQRMKVALEEKPVPFLELHAAIDCYIQMLLVIEALSASGIEDNLDVAEILQNKLYYDAEMLDMVATVLSKYTNQSHKYLDSIINLAYVLLRMLEKYSKSKAYMYVRKKKKKRAGKKRGKKDAQDDEGDGIGQGDEDEEEEADRGTITYSEHAFEFTKFEERFAEEPILQTCMIYLEGYKAFKEPEQMKRIVNLMHRQAVKTKSEGLFFKPTVLELFRRILEDEELKIARDQHATDLKKLIEYILKKFFKAVKDNSLMLLEIFYPKTRNQLGKMRTGELDPYATSDEDGPTVRNAALIREVEVQPGFSLTHQIGIAVAVLVDGEKLSLVELILEQLALASAARTEVVITTDGDSNALPDEDDGSDEALRRKASRLQGPSKEAVALFSPHIVEWRTDSERKSGWSNANFKLLMRLLEWQSSEVPEAHDLVWTIPATTLPSKLDGDIRIIKNFLLDPVDPNGKTAAELLRKKRKAPQRRARQVASDDEEAADEGGSSAPKTKRARKRKSVGKSAEDGDADSDEPTSAPRKRQKKRKEEAAAYKSAQFIEDSDDEDNAERDERFYAAEQVLRDKLNAGAIAAAAATGSKKSKKKKSQAAVDTADTDTDAPAEPARKRRKGELPGAIVVRSELVVDTDEEEEVDETRHSPGGSSTSAGREPSSEGVHALTASVTSQSSPGRSEKQEAQIPDAGADVAPTKKKRRAVIESDED